MLRRCTGRADKLFLSAGCEFLRHAYVQKIRNPCGRQADRDRMRTRRRASRFAQTARVVADESEQLRAEDSKGCRFPASIRFGILRATLRVT